MSRGNVTRSAKQAAAPALAIFTPSGGGTSDGLSPTIVYKYWRPGEQRDRTRVNHQLGPVLAFYEALTCSDYIKKINPDCTHSLKAPCDLQAYVLPGRVRLARLQSIQRPAAGKGRRHLWPCVYISAEAACLFYGIHREALLCTAGHTGLIKVHWQSESQCSISLPTPAPHHNEKNNSFTFLHLLQGHWKANIRTIHVFSCVQ